MDSPSSEHAPLVSVIVAVCADDRADLFGRALDSMFCQTLADWECIVAADGPLTPGLEAIIGARAAVEPRLRRTDLPIRSGPAKARNRAVAEARGRYVAILDADDAARPERLARQAAFLEKSGVDVGGARCVVEGIGAPVRNAPLGEAKVRRTLWRRNPLVHSTVMARTEVLRAHPYPEHLRYGEDYRLWADLALAGFRMDNLPEELATYTVNAAPKPHGGRWGRFAGDAVTRLRALRLLPAPLAVLYAPAAVAIAAMRLMPDPVWRLLRRIG